MYLIVEAVNWLRSQICIGAGQSVIPGSPSGIRTRALALRGIRKVLVRGMIVPTLPNHLTCTHSMSPQSCATLLVMEPTSPYPAGVCTIYPPSSKNVWRIRWKAPDGSRQERTAKNRIAAEKKAAEITAEVANPSSAINITVKFLADAYLASIKPGYYRERQEGLYRLWILPEIGHLYLTEWKPAHSRMVLEAMAKKGIGSERVKNAAQAMRALVSYAQQQGWFTVADDPMLKVKQKVESQFDEDKADIQGESSDFVARETLPTLDDVKLLVKSASDPIWSLAWSLTAYSGVRWSELIALRGEDIDQQGRIVKVTKSVSQWSDAKRRLQSTKNTKRRTSIFPASLVEPLEKRMWEVGPKGLLFPGPDGSWVERTWHRRQWIRAAQRAGWPFETYENPTQSQRQWPAPKWSIHDLRHFAACWMIFDLKAPLPTVTTWLGHHSPSFTFNKYVGHRGDIVQIGLDLTEGW